MKNILRNNQVLNESELCSDIQQQKLALDAAILKAKNCFAYNCKMLKTYISEYETN